MTPAIAVATAMTTFKIVFQMDFFIIQHLLSIPHYPLLPILSRCRIGRFLTTAAWFVITRTSGVSTASRSQCFRQLVDVDICRSLNQRTGDISTGIPRIFRGKLATQSRDLCRTNIGFLIHPPCSVTGTPG